MDETWLNCNAFNVSQVNERCSQCCFIIFFLFCLVYFLLCTYFNRFYIFIYLLYVLFRECDLVVIWMKERERAFNSLCIFFSVMGMIAVIFYN